MTDVPAKLAWHLGNIIGLLARIEDEPELLVYFDKRGATKGDLQHIHALLSALAEVYYRDVEDDK